LGVLKGQEVYINLVNDGLIYHKLFKYSEVECKMIQAWIKKLMEFGLMELSPLDCEYASTMVRVHLW